MFGIQDALTRQTLTGLQGNSWTVLFTTWSAYALIGAGIVGIWLMQNAFSAAPLHASLPAVAAGEPLAGIVLGIVVFGDRVQVTAGLLAIEAAGIASLIIGVIAVARSSALSGLRKITDVIRPGTDSGGPQGPRPAGRPDAPRRLTPPQLPERLRTGRVVPDGAEVLPARSPASGSRLGVRRRGALSRPGAQHARARPPGGPAAPYRTAVQ